MEYAIEIGVSEFDVRSSQFSCEVTIVNQGDDPIEILAVTPRLPKGVRMNVAVDAIEMQLLQRHSELCDLLKGMIGTNLVMHSREEAIDYVERLQKWFAEALTPRSVFRFYGSVVIGRTPAMLKKVREGFMRLPITSLKEAERAFEILKSVSPPRSTSIVSNM